MILGERIGLSARRLPVALAEHAALALHLSSSQHRATVYDAANEQGALDVRLSST